MRLEDIFKNLQGAVSSVGTKLSNILNPQQPKPLALPNLNNLGSDLLSRVNSVVQPQGQTLSNLLNQAIEPQRKSATQQLIEAQNIAQKYIDNTNLFKSGQSTQLFPTLKVDGAPINGSKPLLPQYLRNAAAVPAFGYNFIAGIPNAIGGAGIVDPVVDVSRQLSSILRNDGSAPNYNELKSPAARIGYQLGDTVFNGGRGGFGASHSPTEYIGNVAGAIEPIASAYGGEKIFGLGGQGAAAKTLNEALLQGAKSGASSGAVFGGLQGLETGRKQANGEGTGVVNQLFQGGAGAIQGGLFGGALGAAFSGGGYALNKAIEEYKKAGVAPNAGFFDPKAKIISSANPTQKALEDAWKNNDLKKAQSIIDSLPDNDPYKPSMQSLQDATVKASGGLTKGGGEGAQTGSFQKKVGEMFKAPTAEEQTIANTKRVEQLKDLIRAGKDYKPLTEQQAINNTRHLAENEASLKELLSSPTNTGRGETNLVKDLANKAGVSEKAKWQDIPLSKIKGTDYAELDQALSSGQKMTPQQANKLIGRVEDPISPGRKIETPIAVTPNPDGTYSLQGGNNRVAQALVNGDKTIPAVSNNFSDGKTLDEFIKTRLSLNTGGIVNTIKKRLTPPEDVNPQGGFAKLNAVIGGDDLEQAVADGKITKQEANLLRNVNKAIGEDQTPKNLKDIFSKIQDQPDNAPQEVSRDVRKIINGNEIKDKSLVTRMKASDKFSPGLQEDLQGKYVTQTNEETKALAKRLIADNPKLAETRALHPQNAVDIQAGAELFNKYMSAGNIEKANEILNASSGTNEGQMVQILSQYDKTSPIGAVKFAKSKVNEYNKLNPDKPLDLSSNEIKGLFEQAKGIQAMPQGKERNIAANQLINKVNDMIPSSITDKAITVWKAGLLTSLRTTERNLFGNTLMQAGEIAKDPVASVADIAMSQSTGKRSMTSTLSGFGEGAKTGVQAAKDTVTLGFDPNDDISKYDIRHVTWGNNGVEQALKKYTGAVFNTLAAEDKPFWNASYARSLYDQAGAEAINAGKQGNAGFVQNLVKNPTEGMAKNAAIDANFATFHDQNAFSKAAVSIKRTLSTNELSKLGSEVLAPFTGVPTSVAGKMVDYSPIGLTKGLVDAGKVTLGNLPNLQRQAAQEIGRGVVGTGIIALGTYLGSKGLVTGNPKDAAESRQWQLEGKQSNSILLFGKWRSLNSVGPQTLVFLTGAKLAEAAHAGGGISSVIGNTVAQAIKDYTQQTFLQGIQEPLAVINDPNQNKPERYLGAQTASIIPNIIKDTSKAFDPLIRENNVFKDYITNSIPGLRNQNVASRDVLGNQIKNDVTGVSAYLDLFNSRSPIHNAVVDELGRLNETGNNATPGKLIATQTINGNKMKLTPEQLDVLESNIGPAATEALGLLFENASYQALSDEDKGNAIQSLLTSVRKGVRSNIDVNAAPNNTGIASNQSGGNKTGNGQYMIVSDSGTVKQVDLDTPIATPNYTGDAAYDKVLKSAYTSAISTRKSDIVKLAEQGKISKEEAVQRLAQLNGSSSGGTGGTASSKKLNTTLNSLLKALDKPITTSNSSKSAVSQVIEFQKPKKTVNSSDRLLADIFNQSKKLFGTPYKIPKGLA